MCPNVEDGRAVRFFDQAMHFFIPLHEIRATVRILRLISRRDDYFARRPENFKQGFLVVCLGRRQ